MVEKRSRKQQHRVMLMLGCYVDLLAACSVLYGFLSIPGQNVSCGACPPISRNLEVASALPVLVLKS
jgi:hypothetical protein